MTISDEGHNIRRNRRLWAVICWVVCVVLAGFGTGYAILGQAATSVPGAYSVVTRWVPGGLHTYGAVLLCAAALLLHGLLPALYGQPMLDWWLQRVLPFVAGLAFLLVWLFAWSWALSGVQTWQAMIYWGSESALAMAGARWFPPSSDRSGRVA